LAGNPGIAVAATHNAFGGPDPETIGPKGQTARQQSCPELDEKPIASAAIPGFNRESFPLLTASGVTRMKCLSFVSLFWFVIVSVPHAGATTVNLNENQGTPATATSPAVAALTIEFDGEGRLNINADQDLFDLIANIALSGNQQVDLATVRNGMGAHRSVRLYKPDHSTVQARLRSEIASGQSTYSGAGAGDANATWDGIWDRSLGTGEALGYGVKLDAHNDPHVLVRPTRLGDADLNGVADSADLSLLLANFNQLGTHWSQGNFNYSLDGTNSADLSLLLASFNQAFTAGEATVLSSAVAVPEPSTALLALFAACGAWRLARRR
jgi:hypothetical protein